MCIEGVVILYHLCLLNCLSLTNFTVKCYKLYFYSVMSSDGASVYVYLWVCLYVFFFNTDSHKKRKKNGLVMIIVIKYHYMNVWRWLQSGMFTILFHSSCYIFHYPLGAQKKKKKSHSFHSTSSVLFWWLLFHDLLLSHFLWKFVQCLAYCMTPFLHMVQFVSHDIHVHFFVLVLCFLFFFC